MRLIKMRRAAAERGGDVDAAGDRQIRARAGAAGTEPQPRARARP